MSEKDLHFKISAELHSKLKEESNKKNINLTSLIRLILAEYFISKEEK